jgi:hypothetical protein
VWVLVGYLTQGEPVESEESAILLDEAKSAWVKVQHGAGKLSIGSGAGAMELLSGSFGSCIRYQSRVDDDQLKVILRVGDGGFPYVVFPWFWGKQNVLDWDIRITDEIPIQLRLSTGASDARLDLTDLQITDLRLETGASSTDVSLPDNVDMTKVVIKAGAASVNLKIPDNVAAKIRVTGGLKDAKVNRERFPKTGGYFQSKDYETAINKADIRIDIGVGSVSIH